jgi:NADH pyrophosphatase NudC (nudix superfamily)
VPSWTFSRLSGWLGHDQDELDDAQWLSLMLVVQPIPLACKRDKGVLRRFVEAIL